MDVSDIADRYFAFEARLESFQISHQLTKRRASNASTKGGSKSIKWPHKFMSGEELARAGFFYHPTPNNPDNVACFLCQCNLDGWEHGDDPLAEHLKHVPGCGWAIVASIEKGNAEFIDQYPASSTMIEARKATFDGRWPHEGKRGWKCKTKQLVDSGWKYTPTVDSDDMATCCYCFLALDGWEPGDKPMDEHFKRSPECPFFTLVSNHKQSPAAKRAKGKGRASKASRLSSQSILTTASEAPSILEEPAVDEDSILTTATNATVNRGKMAKAKKAAPARKMRAKKGEPVEVESEDNSVMVKPEASAKPPRGRKRKSEDDSQSVTPVEEIAPPPKRRATRTRSSQMSEDNSIMSIIEPSKPAPKKGRQSRATRKVSAASAAPMRSQIPDDDEIDRALEADLARSLTDNEEGAPDASPRNAQNQDHLMFGVGPAQNDEEMIDAELQAMEAESKPIPKAKGAKGKQPQARKVSAKQRAAAKKAEAAAEAEAERIAAEEASQQITAELEHSISMQQSSPVIVPKKARGSTRQPQKQVPKRATRGSVMSTVEHDVHMDDAPGLSQNDESGNETDVSVASQSTVIRNSRARRGSTIKSGRVGKKGASRNIEEIVHKEPEPEPESEPEVVSEMKPSSVAKGKKVMMHAEEVTLTEEVYYAPLPEAPVPEPMEEDSAPEPVKTKATKARGRPRKISAQREPLPLMLSKSVNARPAEGPTPVEEPVVKEPTPAEEMAPVAHTTTMPGTMPSSPPRSPTPPPKELTPSQSPQSSDAENHPPSSKPSAAVKKTVTPRSSVRRVPLGDATPGNMSPSKRNVIAGLQTNAPWTSVDLDTIFMKSPNSENIGNIFGSALDKAKDGELTSPEKKMTVEEWVKHNAELAEAKLRDECERIVGLFENEGTRAMEALEGVECLE